MPARIFLFLVLLAPVLALASDIERAQVIRGKAFSVCSNLLVFYNPNQGESDPRYAQRYRSELIALQQLVEQIGEPRLIKAVADMGRNVNELERQSPGNSVLLPHWINPLLKAQARLDRRIEEQYPTSSLSEASQVLYQLSLNIDRIELLYQARTFGGLVVYSVDGNDAAFTELDSARC